MLAFSRTVCLLIISQLVAWASPVLAQDSYPIGAGDVIGVSIVPKPELNRRMTVGLDGKIFLPLVGEFEVSGKTIDELRQEILQKMTGAVYRDRIEGESVLVAISGDEVLVEVAAYRPIYIDGDVARAGEIPFSVGITVRQAIAAAHGFADQEAQNRAFADENAIAIRARIAALQTETVYHRAIANGTTSVDNAALARIEILPAPIEEVLDRMNQRL